MTQANSLAWELVIVTFTDRAIARIPVPAKRLTLADPHCPCLYVRITPAGWRSFVVVVRGAGKQVWVTLGRCDVMSVDEARTQAREIIGRVHRGEAAIAPRGPLFAAIAASWQRRYVEAKGLRSEREIARVLARYVLPAIGDRAISSLRRSDVVALLDRVEDTSGARTADYCLSVIRQVCGWHAKRDDSFATPIVPGMRRHGARVAGRVLSDDELRRIWAVGGPFGSLVKILLLTGQRRSAVLAMRWADIRGRDWHIPVMERAKGTGGLLVLPDLAMEVIRGIPRIHGCPFVFAGRGRNAMAAGSASKAVFDAVCGVHGWRIHDLRVTARSLMGRAGIDRETAERVLGHKLRGAEKHYDMHEYKEAKAEALRKLAGVIRDILIPPPGNIVRLRGDSQ